MYWGAQVAAKPCPHSSVQWVKSAGVRWLGQVRRGLAGLEEGGGLGLDDDVVGGVAGGGDGVGGFGVAVFGGVVLDDYYAAPGGEIEQGFGAFAG